MPNMATRFGNACDKATLSEGQETTSRRAEAVPLGGRQTDQR